GLVRVVDRGAVVAGVRRMVIVGVRVVVVTWADVAGVADPVAVRVGLIGVRRGRAVVGNVDEAVAVGVLTRIADTVAVLVRLAGVRDGRAVVAGVADAVAVAVRLVGIGDRGAVVAAVRNPVAVAVARPADAEFPDDGDRLPARRQPVQRRPPADVCREIAVYGAAPVAE